MRRFCKQFSEQSMWVKWKLLRLSPACKPVKCLMSKIYSKYPQDMNEEKVFLVQCLFIQDTN